MSTLSDTSQDNVGWVYPPGPQTEVNQIPEIDGTMSGMSALVIGQSYVDVVFGTALPNADWVLLETAVANTVDVSPLNLWPGIITSKTTTGFRVQLNGLPDTGNYYLNWSIKSVFGYFLSGPSSAFSGQASSAFSVMLPPDSGLSGSVVIIPNDGGAGGTFSPSTMSLNAAAPSAAFTYTPSSAGSKVVSTTNNLGLSNPVGIAVNVTSPTYTLTGPSSGNTGAPSTNFTVALSQSVTGTVTVTPHATGGGTFTPTTVSLTTGAPSATFTYTPASVGAKTISVTNSGGLTNPGNLTYTASAPPIADGDPISSWPDSSGHGHTATQTGSARPIYKTNIINSKPVARFTSASSQYLNIASAISSTSPWTVFAVMKASGTGVNLDTLGSTVASFPRGITHGTDDNMYSGDKVGYCSSSGSGAPSTGTAFHVLSVGAGGGGAFGFFVDGTQYSILTVGATVTGDFDVIGRDGSGYSDGDIAEILIYSGIIQGNGSGGSHDRDNIEKYLGTQYGITVAAGTVIDPSTVTGLLAWWKADAIT